VRSGFWQEAHTVYIVVDAWFNCCMFFKLHLVMIVLETHHNLNISSRSTIKTNYYLILIGNSKNLPLCIT